MPITLEDVLIALEEKYYPGFSLESMEDLIQERHELNQRITFEDYLKGNL